jgi:hypothetical protein
VLELGFLPHIVLLLMSSSLMSAKGLEEMHALGFNPE